MNQFKIRKLCLDGLRDKGKPCSHPCKAPVENDRRNAASHTPVPSAQLNQTRSFQPLHTWQSDQVSKLITGFAAQCCLEACCFLHEEHMQPLSKGCQAGLRCTLSIWLLSNLRKILISSSAASAIIAIYRYTLWI